MQKPNHFEFALIKFTFFFTIFYFDAMQKSSGHAFQLGSPFNVIIRSLIPFSRRLMIYQPSWRAMKIAKLRIFHDVKQNKILLMLSSGSNANKCLEGFLRYRCLSTEGIAMDHERSSVLKMELLVKLG